MNQDLQPNDPLSQVVFVHNYLQLVFQDCAFTLNNIVTYAKGSTTIRQGQVGFCDSLVALIDQTAQVELLSDSLVLRFVGGAMVSISGSGKDVRGPEAWQFDKIGGPNVVEQNA